MSEDSLEMWLRVAPMFTGISVIYRKISGSLVLFLFLHFVCRDETTSVSNMTNLASRNAYALYVIFVLRPTFIWLIK